MSHGVPTTTSWMTSHGVPTGIYMPIGTKLRSKLLVCHASYKFGEQLLKHCFQFTVGDYSRVIEWLTVGDYSRVNEIYILWANIQYLLSVDRGWLLPRHRMVDRGWRLPYLQFLHSATREWLGWRRGLVGKKWWFRRIQGTAGKHGDDEVLWHFSKVDEEISRSGWNEGR